MRKMEIQILMTCIECMEADNDCQFCKKSGKIEISQEYLKQKMVSYLKGLDYQYFSSPDLNNEIDKRLKNTPFTATCVKLSSMFGIEKLIVSFKEKSNISFTVSLNSKELKLKPITHK